ncbi:DUF2274 domain-containing protein [Asticcacaulis sp. YBE204]|uniref:DUF2274 domain-containing protein n=1 Tax=Asticcacaulis sp. YBE204 TaxID=1282363 RepID=UPI0003C3FB8F|nr:DUF2274 domain-containing protein [Asticcacaulis sp. YBE204]ESQ78716.1 hypothetical protein AEYBE204_12080 [Asticcacaulis sp. YBE204]
MAELKLPKLPDRTPIKLTIVIGAELNEALKSYADRYAQAYGSTEQIVDLIPFMLDAFLASDKSFNRTGRR